MKLIEKYKLIEIIQSTKQETFDSTDIERLINYFGDTIFLEDNKTAKKGRLHISGREITLD